MKAYKVFNSDWTCRDFKFEVGKEYQISGKLELCKNGFHACERLQDCFSYYSFCPTNKVAEVELLGEVISHNYVNKLCTDRIRIVRELDWLEVLKKCNTGNNNTGNRNTGDSNTGNRNTGDSNTGNWNIGVSNTGDGNTGNWNTVNRETGFFNTKPNSTIRVFNRKCNIGLWQKSYKPMWLNIRLREWIPLGLMSESEKKMYPEAGIAGGYLKEYSYREAWENAYKSASKEDIEAVKRLPNFSSKVFKEITGLSI